MKRPVSALIVVANLIMLLSGANAVAQDFRIETDVFVNRSKEPAAQTLTLFHSGVVYDFMLSDSEEIVVFNPHQGMFFLLDPVRKMKLPLSKEQILRFMAIMRTMQDGKDPFFFNPAFQETFDEETKQLTLESERVTYRAKGIEPDNLGPVQQYRQFADWYARLNATTPGKMPPFPRLELNRALAERGLVPEEIELTIDLADVLLPKKIEVRSHHLIVWQLSNRDKERIDKANEHLINFQAVEFRQYRSLDKAVAQDGN